LCTGINSLRFTALLAAIGLLLSTGSTSAQVLKLSSLRLPSDVAAGSWVAYQVNVSSKNRPPRRFTQRLSVVSREGSGAEAGVWVELKTIESGKTRMERGYFMPPDAGKDFADSSLYDDMSGGGEAPPSEASATPQGASRSGPSSRLKLARYQRLTSDGKLYEYPVGEEGAPMTDEDVSAMDMLEFAAKSFADTLAPDTLRAGRKVIPCRLRRVRRYGTQPWEGDDSTYVNRALMTRTSWRNQWVPVTGYGRLVVVVSTERVPIHAGAAPVDSAAHAASAAPPDTSHVGTAAPPPQPGPDQDFFYKGEATLVDLGRDAVPEVTQAAEPAPQEAIPKPRTILK